MCEIEQSVVFIMVRIYFWVNLISTQFGFNIWFRLFIYFCVVSFRECF